jgi:hypothetical protein
MSISAICKLKSISPLSFSKHYTVPKLEKELHADYEVRTWRERLHYDKDGIVYIPPMAFKLCLAETPKFLGHKVPGRRNATWTKHFESGVLMLEGLSLGVHKDKVEGETLFVPSDGKRGGGSRVEKIFPVIPEWEGTVTFHILDTTITKDVFTDHLREAGNFIGLLRFRPRNGGFYGRFEVESVKWNRN